MTKVKLSLSLSKRTSVHAYYLFSISQAEKIVMWTSYITQIIQRVDELVHAINICDACMAFAARSIAAARSARRLQLLRYVPR